MVGCAAAGLAQSATTFLIESQHTAETCPAQSEQGIQMMADLVIGTEHATRSGVSVVERHVVLGKHRLLLLIEADDPASVERYAEPFRMVGSVTINPIGTCEAVMEEAIRELHAQAAA